MLSLRGRQCAGCSFTQKKNLNDMPAMGSWKSGLQVSTHRNRKGRISVLPPSGNSLADANIDGFNAVHYIEFGNAHTGNARLIWMSAFQGGGIKPARSGVRGRIPSRISCPRSAKPAPTSSNNSVRNGPEPTRAVIGFDDAQNMLIQHLRTYARASRSSSRRLQLDEGNETDKRRSRCPTTHLTRIQTAVFRRFCFSRSTRGTRR